MSRPTEFRPSAREPWDEERAAHLARRAGFGATAEELSELVSLGFDGAVDHFVDVPAEEPELEKKIAATGGELLVLDDPLPAAYTDLIDKLRHWWIFRLAYSRHPLREKACLFWHDHFACQASKVLRAPVLEHQLRLFLERGLGGFRELVRGVAADPCMLVFLDNRLSDAQNPNENWGRELVELFTLGVDRYTQEDVSELARIFTGWTTPAPNEPAFLFEPAMHDTGDKVLFGEPLRGREGEAGVEEGHEAIDRILARRECADFLAHKLCAWFGSHAPPAEVVAGVADALVESDYSIRAALRTLFRSAWFYDESVRFGLVRNPVEHSISVCHALGMQNAHLAGLVAKARRMGMNLLEPPSVAGWNHGESWIDSGSVVQRLNFALEISEMAHTRRVVQGRPAIDFDALAGDAEDDASILSTLSRRLVGRPLGEDRDRVLLDYLADFEGDLDPSLSPTKRRREKIRALVHLLLTTPEMAYA